MATSFLSNRFSGKREVYLEVAERYERFIRLGIMKNGDKLPSVRVAAGELGVNPNTVQKAYAHLEAQGLIRSLPQKGSFVAFGDEAEKEKAAERRALTTQALTALKEQGITEQEIISLIKEVYSHD